MPLLQITYWTFRRVVWATLVLVFVVFCFWLLYRFNQVVFILFIAIVMGTVMRPVVTWLYGRGLPRLAGVILVYLILLILLIGFMLLFLPLIIEQGTMIVAAIPDYYQSLRLWMTNYPNQLIVRLSEFLPAELPVMVPIQQTGQQILDSVDKALDYASLMTKIIFMAIAFPLLTLHWTLDGPRIIQSLVSMFPKTKREGMSELFSSMETKVSSYIGGQGLLCLIIGVIALVTYLLLGLPNALVLALVAGVLEVVPMIGPGLGAIPAALIALSIAPSKFVLVIIVTIVVQQLENSILVPRVMNKAVGVNPLVSLLAIFGFSSLFGFAGTLMAIPLAAIIQLLLDRFVFNPIEIESEISSKRNLTSRLRYEVRDLAQGLRKQARIKKGGTDLRVKQIDRVMDEIESISNDLDSLLAKISPSGTP